RVTADGRLRPCLLNDRELDLLPALPAADPLAAVTDVVLVAAHREGASGITAPTVRPRTMVAIGGRACVPVGRLAEGAKPRPRRSLRGEQGAHGAANSLTSRQQSSGRSRYGKWPAPARTSSRAPGMASASPRITLIGANSSSPVITMVGTGSSRRRGSRS